MSNFLIVSPPPCHISQFSRFFSVSSQLDCGIIVTQVGFLSDVHGHLCEAEVIGLLAGEGSLCISVEVPIIISNGTVQCAKIKFPFILR